MRFQHGERVIGIAKDYVCQGYFVGAIRKLNGEILYVIQLSPVSDQIFIVKRIESAEGYKRPDDVVMLVE